MFPPPPSREESHSMCMNSLTGEIRDIPFAISLYTRNHRMSALNSWLRVVHSLSASFILLRVARIRAVNFRAWHTQLARCTSFPTIDWMLEHEARVFTVHFLHSTRTSCSLSCGIAIVIFSVFTSYPSHCILVARGWHLSMASCRPSWPARFRNV